MTSNQLVSVVTPSYNQADFIRETIESVRAQTYGNVEHVVVDGESTDGTTEILDEYDHLRYVSEPDDGQSDAINKRLGMANGEVVAWLNSDDVFFDTGVLKRAVKYLDERDAEVIYGDMALLDGDSNVLKLQCVPDFDIHKLLRYCFIEQPALFFDGEVVSQHRLDENLEYVMDYEFWLRLSRKYEFQHVDDVLSGDWNHEQRERSG